MSCVQINGLTGIYDKTINDASVRYGRNAVNNYQNYIQSYCSKTSKLSKCNPEKIASLSYDKFSKKMQKANSSACCSDKFSQIPLNYELRYQQEGEKGAINTMSLMGAAYEQLGQKIALPVRKVTKMFQSSFSQFKNKISANALDTNKDKKIDLAEYASYMIVSDILSTEPESSILYGESATGTITNQGKNASYSLFDKSFEQQSKKIFEEIQYDFELDAAQEVFISEPNNLI